ncbi:MAG: hypothetical protein ACR2IE_15710 [Candidatus Sumerlaeaceae bacterium]
MILRNSVEGNVLEWSPDGSKIAVVNASAGNWDIALVGRDGNTTQVTSAMGRNSSPLFTRDGSLFSLGTEPGKNVLYRHGPWANDVTSPALIQTHDVLFASAGRDKIAFYSCQNFRPQLGLFDPRVQRVDIVTSESDALAIDLSQPKWNSEGDKLLYLHDGGQPSHTSKSAGDVKAHVTNASTEKSRSPTELHIVSVTSEGRVSDKKATQDSEGIQQACFTTDPDKVAYLSNGVIKVRNVRGRGSALVPVQDLSASLMESAAKTNSLALVLEDQLLGVVSPVSGKPHILTFDLQDKFLLAEEYFRKGSTSKSYALYEELASSVERTQDPDLAKFVYAANLQRLGRTREAVKTIEKILSSRKAAPTVPRQYLWKALGYSYLLSLDDHDKARMYFERYEKQLHRGDQTTTSRDASQLNDTALNALAILRRNEPRLTRRFASAVRSRLAGNVRETDRAFGELLRMAPELSSVQREYLHALEGYDRDVYYFSPTERPFSPSPRQTAAYLERFLEIAPQSSLADATRLKLFLLHVESGQYSNARELLVRELNGESAGADSIEGVFEVFGNYLETAEMQPWLEAAMGEVFLHSSIRPKLQESVEQTSIRFLIHLSAAKLALVQQRNDDARQELDGALALWQQLEEPQRNQTMNRFFARLICMRAKEAETRNLFAEAVAYYEQALTHLERSQTDEFEFYAEISYRADFLRHALTEGASLAAEQVQIEKISGDEVVNPSWDVDRLRRGFERQIQRYDSTTSATGGKQRLVYAYECAILLRKMGRTWQARAGLREASEDFAPEFLRQKSLLELSSLDEASNDPWNAARWLEEVSALAAGGGYMHPWISYNIARLHLGMNYQREAAREALAEIVSSRPGTPLSIQAQELLANSTD